MIRSVIIGTAHMHCNEIAMYIHDEPEDIELVGVADLVAKTPEHKAARYTRKWNFDNIVNTYGVKGYEDFEAMLDESKPEIAFILCENYRKPEVVLACAKRRINVVVEKPMATSYKEALKIKKYAEEYGIEAYVNWPVVWRPYVLKMNEALKSGVVGDPIRLRYINGHTGPLGKGAVHRGVTEAAEEMTDEERSLTWWHRKECGGGTYLDICCYGCLYTEWFLGDGAKEVSAVGMNLATPCGDTEDNAAAIVSYGNKFSVIEGTWTTPNRLIPTGPMAVCTDGVIMTTGGDGVAPDVKCVDMYGKDIALPEYTPKHEYKNMPCNYVAFKKNGTPIHEPVTLSFNLKAMAILDAVVRSGESGKRKKVLK